MFHREGNSRAHFRSFTIPIVPRWEVIGVQCLKKDLAFLPFRQASVHIRINRTANQISFSGGGPDLITGEGGTAFMGRTVSEKAGSRRSV
jgi:hypothetical protein